MSRAAVLLRIGGAVLLAVAALLIFLPGRRMESPAPAASPSPAQGTASGLDAGIDTVLNRFGIPPSSVRKRSLEVPGEAFARTERLVALPDTVVPVAVNAALNAMAHAHGARAVASEDTRFRTVTIHIELAGVVLHTIILRTIPPAPPGARARRISI